MIGILLGLDAAIISWWGLHGRLWLVDLCIAAAGLSILGMRRHRRWSVGGVWILLGLSVLTCVEHATGVDLKIGYHYTDPADNFIRLTDGVTWPTLSVLHPGRMSILSTITLFWLALGLLLWEARWRQRFWWTHLCLMPAVVLVYSVLIFHLYRWTTGVPIQFAHVNMGRSISLLFAVLIGCFITARSDRGIFAMLMGPTLLAGAARWLLLVALLVLPVIGILRLKGQQWGWYAEPVGLGLYMSITAVLFVGMIFWGLSRLLQEEAERQALLVREHRALVEATTANLMKDEFLATVSHELRTPLTTIIGWVTMLVTKRLESVKAEKALLVILRAANQQSRLVDDLLDASQILAGNFPITLGTVGLTEMIEAGIESVEPMLEAKQIGLETIFPVDAGQPDLCIRGDRERLIQVVLNLLSNAVKFTPAGGHIVVQLQRVASGAQIVVRDTGCGIAPDVLPFVFDRFRQADSSMSREVGGVGLGLSIVHHLVAAHGGHVTAESQGVGHGARFTVSLPLAASA